jgi:hypothetical protein
MEFIKVLAVIVLLILVAVVAVIIYGLKKRIKNQNMTLLAN